MIINRETLAAVFQGLSTIFNNAMKDKQAKTQWQRIAMKVPSTTKSNDYKWLGSWPKMRKWIGDKFANSLAAFGYSITNEDWEVTIVVDRNDIKDDQLGIYGPQSQMGGESAAELPEDIVSSLINNGFTEKCFDGQYFFDTDHPIKEGVTASNMGTVAFDVSTLANAKASYGAGRTAMRQFKDEHGRSLKVKPDVLVVGPALEDEARAFLLAEKLEDGKNNPYRGTAELVVWDDIESDTFWMLLDTTKPVKPFIYQEREAPHFVEQTDNSSDDVFNRKEYKYGAEARAAGGYGFWQLAWASTGAG